MCNFVRADTTCTPPLSFAPKKAAQFLCRLVHVDSGMKIIFSRPFISSRLPPPLTHIVQIQIIALQSTTRGCKFPNAISHAVSESANENHYTKERCFLMEIYCSFFYFHHWLKAYKKKKIFYGRVCKIQMAIIICIQLVRVGLDCSLLDCTRLCNKKNFFFWHFTIFSLNFSLNFISSLLRY